MISLALLLSSLPMEIDLFDDEPSFEEKEHIARRNSTRVRYV